MNLFRGDIWVPWSLQAPRFELPKVGINVVRHHCDDCPRLTFETAEEDEVTSSGENTESVSAVRVVPFDVLKIENLGIELDTVRKPAAPNLGDDRHREIFPPVLAFARYLPTAFLAVFAPMPLRRRSRRPRAAFFLPP